MTGAPRLTRHDIDELTAYLPRLYADGFSPVLRWHGGEKGADGSYSLPYPEYHPLAEVRSMLTFCAQGERFSDGYIRRLLERLITIRRSLG